jgi:hypothetical protein
MGQVVDKSGWPLKEMPIFLPQFLFVNNNTEYLKTQQGKTKENKT